MICVAVASTLYVIGLQSGKFRTTQKINRSKYRSYNQTACLPLN